MIFVCFGESIRPDEEVKLKSTYFNSRYFHFDANSVNENYEELFRYLQRTPLKSFRPQRSLNFSPLIMHTNSISTGLVFNYYPYLDRQIGSSKYRFCIRSFSKKIFLV